MPHVLIYQTNTRNIQINSYFSSEKISVILGYSCFPNDTEFNTIMSVHRLTFASDLNV